MALTRRELVQAGVSMGVALLAAPALAAGAAPLPLTPENALGPFYKRGAPASTNLIVPGDPGLPLLVSGKVLDPTGKPLSGAIVEVWHADSHGVYDLEGYRYRSRLIAGADGTYRFQTILPGHYPERVAQHIHYRVSAPGKKVLVTQLYFATDPAFAGDPDHNFSRDPLVEDRRLVRPVTLDDSGGPRAAVAFDTVLGT
jgi:protocatechuate 3,4-dioxygenase beta subunit